MRRALPLLIAAFFVTMLLPTGTSEPPAVDRLLAPLGADLAAIHETMLLPRATWYNDADGNKIFDSLEDRFAAAPGLPQPVIVTFRHGVDFDAALAGAQAAAGGFEPSIVYRSLGGFSAELTLAQVRAAAALPAIRQVEWDHPGEPELDTATVNFGVRAVQEALNITGDLDGQRFNFTPHDVTVGILDSGFDGDHVDLKGKFIAFLDAADRQMKEPYDSGNHGTHVASIVGGLGRGAADRTGVAPGAAFVGIKIPGAQGGTTSGALWGYDWLLEHKDEYNIRVTTISYGFGITSDGTHALELAVDKLWAAGIVNFKSTGNSGPEKGTVTVPGGARGIIATASMKDPSPGGLSTSFVSADPLADRVDYGFRLSTFSSRGPTADGRIKPDIAAPGQSISAALAGSGDGYASFSGTSMASPFAAGTAALMIAADPQLTQEEVRRIMFKTAEDWGAPGPDIDYGHGRLDALRAVQTVLIERFMRDGAPYERLVEVADVTPPDIPFHASGVVGSLNPSATFTVEDAGKPVAVTVLINSSLPSVGPADLSQVRLIVAEVAGPDDVVVGMLSANPAARHHTITFTPRSTGTHTLNFLNLVAGEQVIWDVSAGLPPPDGLGIQLPDPAEYAERIASIARPLEEPGGSSVPAVGVVAVLLGFLGAVAAWRRPT